MQKKVIVGIFACLFCTALQAQFSIPDSIPASYLKTGHERWWIPEDHDTVYFLCIDKTQLNFDQSFLKRDTVNFYLLNRFKKDFYLKQGLLHSKDGAIVGNARFELFISPVHFYIFRIYEGVLRVYYDVDMPINMIDWKYETYDRNGNIINLYVKYTDFGMDFENGSGYYKKFEAYSYYDTLHGTPLQMQELMNGKKYHTEFENPGDGTGRESRYNRLSDSLTGREHKIIYLQAEGNIENNRKVGKWKYYNWDGKLTDVRLYKLKDKVDIRFPHCLYNKKEPCFCDKNK